jgi:hypothetical protein
MVVVGSVVVAAAVVVSVGSCSAAVRVGISDDKSTFTTFTGSYEFSSGSTTT